LSRSHKVIGNDIETPQIQMLSLPLMMVSKLAINVLLWFRSESK